MTETKSPMVDMAVEIVSAYVGNNMVQQSDLPGLISEVYKALTVMTGASAAAADLNPAVPVKKSISPDYIICLEDGLKFKSLKRHLRTKFNLTPDEYRTKWGLPRDYPMVAPNYAEARSRLAKAIGLGRKPGTKPAKKRR